MTQYLLGDLKLRWNGSNPSVGIYLGLLGKEICIFFCACIFFRQLQSRSVCKGRDSHKMRGPDGTGRDSFIYGPAAKGKIASDVRSVLVLCSLLACHYILLRSHLFNQARSLLTTVRGMFFSQFVHVFWKKIQRISMTHPSL